MPALSTDPASSIYANSSDFDLANNSSVTLKAASAVAFAASAVSRSVLITSINFGNSGSFIKFHLLRFDGNKDLIIFKGKRSGVSPKTERNRDTLDLF